MAAMTSSAKQKGTNHSLKGTEAFLSVWLVVLARFFFFTSVVCQIFNKDCALMIIRAFGKRDVSRVAKWESS